MYINTKTEEYLSSTINSARTSQITTTNTKTLLSGIQLCLLTDQQGSPPLLHCHWSRRLQLQPPHTAEALFGLGMASLLHRLGSVPVGHPQNGNGRLSTPL